jgi:hypothetical protein
MIIEEDRLILHDLRGVNLRVGFFLGTRAEFLKHAKCITYSICWESVDVRVDQITLSEVSELDFFFSTQQLFIDDQVISGDVIDFRLEPGDIITASCTIATGRA